MGNYVNPGNGAFAGDVRSRIYVDKTGLIGFTNSVLGTRDSRLCVSRPRRFGKSMTIDMLTAYYSCGCDSAALFRGLSIESSPDFEEHLNHYNVIRLDCQRLRLSAIKAGRQDDFVCYIDEQVVSELTDLFRTVGLPDNQTLAGALRLIYKQEGIKFIFLIDEWDVVYRDDRYNKKLKSEFTDFLRELFKGSDSEEYLALVYMTGILPIQKQDTESALNNFSEYTMVTPFQLAKYVGFTEAEVISLCQHHGMSYQEIKDWYDGYHFKRESSVYCPASVVRALLNQEVTDYWTRTSSGKTLQDCLAADMPGLKDAVGFLLAGQPVQIDPDSFGNDMEHLQSVDDVLTLLVHLGYLTYNSADKTVSIPNREVASEFRRVLKRIPGNQAWKIISASRRLLEDTLAMDQKAVALAVQAAHDYYSSTIMYNDENALASVIILAYHCAVDEDYIFFREFPSGKGFADILFLPQRSGLLPILIELKWYMDADTALKQIHEKKYYNRLKGFHEVLLVGINYGKDREKPEYKEHTCRIELCHLQ